ERMALPGDQLNADDLRTWLAERGVIRDPSLAPGWAARTDGTSQWWVWNGSDFPSRLPPGFERGTADAGLMRCLPDSLRQLMQRVLPPSQRDDMNTEVLLDWLTRALPRTEQALRQVARGEMIDATGVLPTFTHMFQVRVQVFRFARAGEQLPELGHTF